MKNKYRHYTPRNLSKCTIPKNDEPWNRYLQLQILSYFELFMKDFQGGYPPWKQYPGKGENSYGENPPFFRGYGYVRFRECIITWAQHDVVVTSCSFLLTLGLDDELMRLLPPSPRGKIDVAPENRPINFPPKGNDLYVGGGNSNIFYFHSDPWGNDPIWQAYFSNGLVQPPTRYCIPTMPFFRLQTCCSFTRVPGISFWELREFPTETEQCQDNQLGSGGFEMPFNQVIKLHLESPGVYIIYDNYMIIYIEYIYDTPPKFNMAPWGCLCWTSREINLYIFTGYTCDSRTCVLRVSL